MERLILKLSPPCQQPQEYFAPLLKRVLVIVSCAAGLPTYPLFWLNAWVDKKKTKNCLQYFLAYFDSVRYTMNCSVHHFSFHNLAMKCISVCNFFSAPCCWEGFSVCVLLSMCKSVYRCVKVCKSVYRCVKVCLVLDSRNFLQSPCLDGGLAPTRPPVNILTQMIKIRKL